MNKCNVTWQIDLTPLVGKKVYIETIEGFIRPSSVLNGIKSFAVELEGYTVETPKDLVVDGDDLIPWEQLKIIRLAERETKTEGGAE